MQTVTKQDCSPSSCSPCSPCTSGTPFDSALGQGVIATGPHSLDNFVASSDTSGFWILFVDKATAPTNGDTPFWSVFVAGATNVQQSFECSPLKVTNGLAFAWSSTPGVVTLAVLTGHVAVSGQYT